MTANSRPVDKHGRPLPEINGMTLVNGGALYAGVHGTIEVLGPGYSNHSKRAICLYMMDGNTKVVCVYGGADYFLVYRYKGSKALKHYRYWKISMDSKNPKYKLVIPQLTANWKYVFKQ